MKRTILTIVAALLIGLSAQGQSSTYNNNSKAGYYNGKVQGSLKSTSINWTVTNQGNGTYKVAYTPSYNSDSYVIVKYSYTDNSGMYVYKPVGSGRWDGGGYVMSVLSSGKLSSYANGTATSGKNVLGILEADGMGYIYVLNN